MAHRTFLVTILLDVVILGIGLTPQEAKAGFDADFSFSPTSPLVTEVISFTDQSLGSPETWCWVFGDEASGFSGCTSSAQNPSHTYTAAGSYVTTLEVSRTVGPSIEFSEKSKTVTVSDAKITIAIHSDPHDLQEFIFTGSLGSFTLVDFEGSSSSSYSKSFLLSSGSYTVTESAVVGWDLTSLDCFDPDGGSTIDLDKRKATIDVDPGETFTCEFVNTQQGSITIIKDAVPNHAQDFIFTSSGGSFTLDDDPTDGTFPNSILFEGVMPGSYPKTETAVAGWTLTAINCVDPDGGTTVNLGTATAFFDVDAGEAVSCTFVNTQSSPTTCVPPLTGRVAWWPFDASSGALATDITRAHAGGYVNDPTPTDGKVGFALRFDGIDDYVEVADDPALNFGHSDDFSLTFWIKAESNPDRPTMVLIDKRASTTETRGYQLFLSNGLPVLLLDDGNTSQEHEASANAFVADGDWHFMAVTLERTVPGGGRWYVDGVEAGRFDPTPGSLKSPAPLRIGGPSPPVDSGGHFSGRIDELEIYNRGLSADEIRSVFEARRSQSSTNLCLNDSRFKVEVSWTDSKGNTGIGQAVSLTSDTGYFWFFDDANVELVVKVLDGRAINGYWWVFYGALSNVAYTLTVTDTQTGEKKMYENTLGLFASQGDTLAFAEASGVLAPVEESPQGSLFPAERLLASPKGKETSLLLNGERFKVEVSWTDFKGDTGVGQAVPLTSDTGYFWFFNDRNVELVVKVLDGRRINGHWWVFYGALSNVEYTLTVTDTETGKTKPYFNPLGVFASNGDTQAFPGD